MKTLFDPCPDGWRVPKNGAVTWSSLNLCYNFTLGNHVSGPANATSPTFALGASGGYHFYRYGISGPTTWHPASGSRYGFSGEYTQVGSFGYLRTTSLATSVRNIFMTLTTLRVFAFDTAIETVAFASGTPVRCLRE